MRIFDLHFKLILLCMSRINLFFQHLFKNGREYCFFGEEGLCSENYFTFHYRT